MSTKASIQSHAVFQDLDYLKEFYDNLSFNVLQWNKPGVPTLCNIDSYIYSSTSGTLDSIRMTLGDGRIADAYALLRRFYDSAILNIYLEHLSIEWKKSITMDIDAFEWAKQITDWVEGKRALPEYRVMSRV